MTVILFICIFILVFYFISRFNRNKPKPLEKKSINANSQMRHNLNTYAVSDSFPGQNDPFVEDFHKLENDDDGSSGKQGHQNQNNRIDTDQTLLQEKRDEDLTEELTSENKIQLDEQDDKPIPDSTNATNIVSNQHNTGSSSSVEIKQEIGSMASASKLDSSPTDENNTGGYRQ